MWFSTKKRNKDDKPTLMGKKEEFGKIIDKWLIMRDDSKDHKLYEPSEEDNFFPVYVMKMMKEIDSMMPHSMLEEIKSAEISSSGHVDYHHKFSLYCAELYMKNI